MLLLAIQLRLQMLQIIRIRVCRVSGHLLCTTGRHSVACAIRTAVRLVLVLLLSLMMMLCAAGHRRRSRGVRRRGRMRIVRLVMTVMLLMFARQTAAGLLVVVLRRIRVHCAAESN